MEITEAIARRVLEVVDAGLTVGIGKPEPGQMCVEAAVCFALDEPHGDTPSCVSPVVRVLKTRLNDSHWSSDTARAKGMRRVAIAQLGTNNAIDEREFVNRIAPLGAEYPADKARHVIWQVHMAAGLQRADADKILSEFAEKIVQILIDLKSPGCQWLYLTEDA
jgi:hypothetical protein